MSAPQRYRKKPVEIDAIEFLGGPNSATEVIEWILAGNGTARYVGRGEYHPMRYPEELYIHSRDVAAAKDAPAFLVIDTLEGAHRANGGDFIIRGVQGEFYPCKPDVFAETYEPVQAMVDVTGYTDVERRLVPGPAVAAGGYIPGPRAEARVYDHGDHRSLDPEHPRDPKVLCDYILTADQVKAVGGPDLLKRFQKELQKRAPKPPDPVLIERRPEVKTQFVVRGPHGFHRQLQPGELPDAGETPVESRMVTFTTELWRGVKVGGEILATADDMPLTKVELDAEYGPWREYR